MERQRCCPVCDSKLRPYIRLADDGTYTVSLESVDSKEQMLRGALYAYWRWKAEGSRPHAHGEGRQFYYDDYHEHIKWLPETDTYRFSIQTYDSPDGDTWWYGEFRLKGRGIEIIKDESRHG